jgi:hypothetical protein
VDGRFPQFAAGHITQNEPKMRDMGERFPDYAIGSFGWQAQDNRMENPAKEIIAKLQKKQR